MTVRALALPPRPLPSPRLLLAEGRVRALVAEVLALEEEREQLEAELAAFAAEWQRRAGAILSELEDADRLVRSLRRLERELRDLAERAAHSPVAAAPDAPEEPGPAAAQRPGAPRFAPRGAGATRPRPWWAAPRRPAEPAAPGGDPVVVEPEHVALKRLHRRLARAVHPDLARGEAERALYADWMARVNAAYHRRDLAALEVLAEKLGLGAAPAEPTEAERLARIERRIVALSAARDAVARDLARLRASEAFRLRRESELRATAGADFAAEACAEAEARTASLRREAVERYDAAVAVAAELERALRRGRGRRAAADAVSGSALARRALALAEIGRPGARGVELAHELERAAHLPEPWEVALTLLAFCAEAGRRPPAALATAAALSERWDALRSAWPGAPGLARALARLPRHLEVGLRIGDGYVAAGLQLSSAEAVAGVRHALATGSLRELARDVLAACGPRERCDTCDAEVHGVHLLRTRGLDEVHGIACPRCGSVLRSYFTWGGAEGLEALAPLALEVGLVAEVHVRFGRRTVGFQMMPAVRSSLTAGRLARLVHALYVQPHAVPLQVGHLALHPSGERRALDEDELVPPGAVLKLQLTGGAMREREVLEWVKDRIDGRFRR